MMKAALKIYLVAHHFIKLSQVRVGECSLRMPWKGDRKDFVGFGGPRSRNDSEKTNLQGGSKKMSHKDLLLKFVLGVRFYFPICVLASEF